MRFKVLGPAIRFSLNAIFPGDDFDRHRKEMAKQLREIADDLENDEALEYYNDQGFWFCMNWERKSKRQKIKFNAMPDHDRKWY